MAAPTLHDVALDGGSSAPPSSGGKVDLEWASFPAPASASAAAAAPATAASASAPASALSPTSAASAAASAASAAQAGEEVAALSGTLACLTPSFYVTLFDVDSADVAARLRLAAWPLAPATFLDTFGSKLDLYGPLWTAATLVFVLAAASNLTSWLAFAGAAAWKYDFAVLTLALGVVYGFLFAVPAALWLLLSYLSVAGVSLVSLVVVTGYSLVPFVPAAALCAAPSPPLQWAALALAASLSALTPFKALWRRLNDQLPPPQARFAAGVLLAAHLLFAVLLKAYFFAAAAITAAS